MTQKIYYFLDYYLNVDQITSISCKGHHGESHIVDNLFSIRMKDIPCETCLYLNGQYSCPNLEYCAPDPGYEDVFDITKRDNIGPVGKGCRDNCLEVKPKDLKGRCCYPDFSVSNGIKLYTSIFSTNLKQQHSTSNGIDLTITPLLRKNFFFFFSRDYKIEKTFQRCTPCSKDTIHQSDCNAISPNLLLEYCPANACPGKCIINKNDCSEEICNYNGICELFLGETQENCPDCKTIIEINPSTNLQPNQEVNVTIRFSDSRFISNSSVSFRIILDPDTDEEQIWENCFDLRKILMLTLLYCICLQEKISKQWA